MLRGQCVPRAWFSLNPLPPRSSPGSSLYLAGGGSWDADVLFLLATLAAEVKGWLGVGCPQLGGSEGRRRGNSSGETIY